MSKLKGHDSSIDFFHSPVTFCPPAGDPTNIGDAWVSGRHWVDSNSLKMGDDYPTFKRESLQ